MTLFCQLFTINVGGKLHEAGIADLVPESIGVEDWDNVCYLSLNASYERPVTLIRLLYTNCSFSIAGIYDTARLFFLEKNQKGPHFKFPEGINRLTHVTKTCTCFRNISNLVEERLNFLKTTFCYFHERNSTGHGYCPDHASNHAAVFSKGRDSLIDCLELSKKLPELFFLNPSSRLFTLISEYLGNTKICLNLFSKEQIMSTLRMIDCNDKQQVIHDGLISCLSLFSYTRMDIKVLVYPNVQRSGPAKYSALVLNPVGLRRMLQQYLRNNQPSTLSTPQYLRNLVRSRRSRPY